MLDSYFWWRHIEQIGGVFPPPKIAILKAHDITLSTVDNFLCGVVIDNGPTRVTVPFSPLAIPGPTWSMEHACVKIEGENDNQVQIRFGGDTYSFRANFAALGVTGRWETPDGEHLPDEGRLTKTKCATYVYAIETWDVSVENRRKYLVDMINETIYEHTLVVVEWLGEIKDGTAVGELKRSIGALDNVYVHE